MRCRGLVLLAVLLLCGPALAADETDFDKCNYWRLGKDEADKANRRTACDRVIAGKSYTPAQRAEAYAERASWDAEDHRRPDAIADLDQALALAPDPSAPEQVGWRRERAFHLYFAEQYDRAIKDFDDVLAARPDDAHVTFFRGLAWLDKNDEARGFADLAKGIELKPQDYWYPYQRANELVKRKRADEALPDLDKAISVKGDEPNPYLLRADIYEKRGETDKAIADLTRVTEIDPKSKSGYLNRAFIYERVGKYDRAIADFDKLLSLDPNYAYAKQRRAALLEKTAARTEPSAPAAEPITTAPEAAKTPEAPKQPEAPKPPEAVKTPEAPKPPERQPEAAKKPEQAAGKLECRRYDAIANRTISIACPD